MFPLIYDREYAVNGISALCGKLIKEHDCIKSWSSLILKLGRIVQFVLQVLPIEYQNTKSDLVAGIAYYFCCIKMSFIEC